MFPETSDPKMPVLLAFDREQHIERCDFGDFLAIYSPERMTPLQLQWYYDTIYLTVSGYANDSRELWEIPEVRSFFQALHRKWPYFMFFLNLENSYLAMFAMCIVPTVKLPQSANGMSRIAAPTGGVMPILDSIAPMHDLFARAGMSYSEEEQRRKAIFDRMFKKFN